MRKCLISNNLNITEIEELVGVNLLNGLIPIVFDAEDKELKEISYKGANASDAIEKITNKWSLENHVDFESNSFKIIYDLKEEIQIDRVLLSGFYNGDADYSLQSYKIYISNDAKTLFNDENLVVHYQNGDKCLPNSDRNHCDQVFDLEDYKGRYFALQILKPCAVDDIARIAHIGVYNHKATEQLSFCSRNFSQNILSGKIPSVVGAYSKDLTPLTDGVCFDETKRIFLNADTEFTFKFDDLVNINRVFVVGSDSAIENCKISVANQKEDLFLPENILEFEVCVVPSNLGAAGVLLFGEEIEAKFIGIRFKNGDYIDQLGVQSE